MIRGFWTPAATPLSKTVSDILSSSVHSSVKDCITPQPRTHEQVGSGYTYITTLLLCSTALDSGKTLLCPPGFRGSRPSPRGCTCGIAPLATNTTR